MGDLLLSSADEIEYNNDLTDYADKYRKTLQREILQEIQQEIECNMESITGKYDKSTPTRDLPSYKIERNEGRKECLAIIDDKMQELEGK